MLQFYYHPLSPLSRRVWIALLEKEISFAPIIINLKEKEQFKREFLAINPFHHIPVIIDDGLRVIESMAILDYLECKYPQKPMLPKEPEQLAKVRMSQMLVNNELSSLIIPLIKETQDSAQLSKVKRKINRILCFLAQLLADDLYFGGKTLSLGDIVAGNTIILIKKLGYNFEQIEQINRWCDRLMQRQPWQITQPEKQQITQFKQIVQELIK
ncbi:glutathione S-transferase-like protein [Chondrocystis sp. NIES-4102]|nr:glutathione S-transferase-like protein [Chondrocystis sp. NIES-4102]